MRNIRELVGSLTQARVQMLAAKVVLEEEAVSEADRTEFDELALNAQKLTRCMVVVEDIRERYTRMNQLPKGDDKS